MGDSKNFKELSGNRKTDQLNQFRVTNKGKRLTSNEGVKISNNEYTLKAGVRGPNLMEDIHFFEKQMHFDHERIPERVVQARGFGAHGEFECYKSMQQYTKACFLQERGAKTPVFVRFSNLQGNKGSSDTTLGPRGFSTKFYTEDGNYDLLMFSVPVFILHDAYKFADAIHALNPEPHNDIPQASSAHDNFWDFVVNNPESTHFVMWAMSDRTAPRSWRMMQGFSINTFRFVNESGKSTYVRFQWKPVLGVHSLLLDEAQIIAGIDPDYHRRDLWDAIEYGAFPEYELGVQILEEGGSAEFDFDILDPTKLWPEEVVPVDVIGKMTLNRNVDNYFSEVEQVAFNPANVIPGIDFSDDPILQGRLFAYRDTQMHRLGSPNFNEIPINRSVCPVHNYMQGGYMNQFISVDRVNYQKNSLANNFPVPSHPSEGGYTHYPEKVEGYKVKAVPDSFKDYFSQPKIFWNSLSFIEKQHLVQALCFQLSKVQSHSIREKAIQMLSHVDAGMATMIADYVGIEPPSGVNQVSVTSHFPSLSIANATKYPITLRVGILIGHNFDDEEVGDVIHALKKHGIFIDFISEKLGTITGVDGTKITVSQTFLTTNPNLYDALYVVGGSSKREKKFNQEMMNFSIEVYKHYKPIGVATNAEKYLPVSGENNLLGVVFAKNNPNFKDEFIAVIAERRFWERV